MAGPRLRGSRIQEAQQGADRIAALFDTIGKQEQLRRERQQLARVAELTATARSEGREVPLADILAELDKPAEIDTGLGGFFQKLGGRLQPDPGRFKGEIQSNIVGDALKRALGQTEFDLTPAEKKKAVRIKAGLLPRVSATTATGPTAQTPEEKARNRDTKILSDRNAKGELKSSPAQQKSAKRRLRANKTLGEAAEQDFSVFLENKDKEKVKGARFDKAFGKKAYEQALEEAKDDALSKGISEASTEEQFNKWWDAKASEADPSGFGKFVLPRSEFQDKVTEKVEEIATTGGKLDQATAQAILAEAGFDKEKARKLAKERGFEF